MKKQFSAWGWVISPLLVAGWIVFWLLTVPTAGTQLPFIISGIAVILIVAGLSFFLNRQIFTALRSLAVRLKILSGNEVDEDPLDCIEASMQTIEARETALQDLIRRAASGEFPSQPQSAGNDPAIRRLTEILASKSQALREVKSGSQSIAGQATGLSAQITGQVSLNTILHQKISQQAGHVRPQEFLAITGKLEQSIRELKSSGDSNSEQEDTAAEMKSRFDQLENTLRKTREDSAAALNSIAAANQSTSAGQVEARKTIDQINRIQESYASLSQRMDGMNDQTGKIGNIVETINDIASETNMLALNAAIEAARTGSLSVKIGEEILQNHLLGVADLLAEMMKNTGKLPSNTELTELTSICRVEDFYITDEDGVIVATNEPALMGFRFSDNPKDQTYAFRALLTGQKKAVIQPVMERSVDSQLFLFCGVARKDRPGIVQAGVSAEHTRELSALSNGFAVVAEEVRRLSDEVKLSAKDIAGLISGIQSASSGIQQSMKNDMETVQQGVLLANRIGQIFQEMKNAFDLTVSQNSRMIAVLDEIWKQSQESAGIAGQMVSQISEENSYLADTQTTIDQAIRQMNDLARQSRENQSLLDEMTATLDQARVQLQSLQTGLQNVVSETAKLENNVSRYN